MTGSRPDRPPEELHRRLEGFREYARLLDEQHALLVRGDVEGLHAAERRLDRLQEELYTLAPPPPPTPGESAGTARLRAEVAAALEEALNRQRRLTALLRENRDSTRSELRELHGRERQLHSYVDRDRPVRTRLNVRF